MFNSSNHYNSINPTQMDNRNGDADCSMPQGDAIYDYERVPAEWNGLDEQPVVYRYGDASAWQNNSDDDSE